MSRTLVQITLLTLLVFASATDVFAQSSTDTRAGEVIGNTISSRMSVIKEPLREPAASSDRGIAQASSPQKSVRVTVMGQVWSPGVYEFRQGAPTLKELTEQSRGLTGYCAHQFYVFKANEKSFKLERDQYASYEFEDGDILLAETSERHYKALGSPEKQHTLAEIHPQTQIVLLNVIDRPVLLSVAPQNATLAFVLSGLRQDSSAMVGHVEHIEPPHAGAIPPNALIAPNMIFSGSILRFDPRAIDRKSLPPLPAPTIVQMSSKVQARSANTMPSNGMTRETGALIVQPVKSKSQAPFPTNLGNSAGMNSQAESEPSGNPFDDAFAEFEASSDETLNSDAPDVPLPTAQNIDQRALLSAQQWRIIVTFVTLMSLFLAAWLIRYRQQKNGIKTFTFIESRTSTSPDSEAEQTVSEVSPEKKVPAVEELSSSGPEVSEAEVEVIAQAADATAAVAQAEVEESLGDISELDGLNREDPAEDSTRSSQISDPYELSSYGSLRSEDPIGENTFEVSIDELGSSPEIAVFDQVESPRETESDEAPASIEGLSEVQEISECDLQTDAGPEIEELDEPSSPVQQSILGTPWIQEISNDLDPHQSDISLDEQPSEVPETEAEVAEAKPQAASKPTSGRFASQQIRIDQAHTQEPHPTPRPHIAKSSSDQAESEATAEGRLEHPSAATNWMKMEDAPQQPEENLDHIFQAIMKERNK